MHSLRKCSALVAPSRRLVVGVVPERWCGAAQDWASVPEDLRKLGFIREDAPNSDAIAEPLGRVLTQLSAGGGAKGLNIDQARRAPSHCVDVQAACTTLLYLLMRTWPCSIALSWPRLTL